MSVQVVEGALLQCTLGENISILKVPKCHDGAMIQGNAVANITDFVPNINIFSFGVCKRNSVLPVCVPFIIMKWLYGQQEFLLEGEMVLLKECIVPCLHGGILSIVNSGIR